MTALQAPAPAFTAASKEKFTGKTLNSFILIEDGDVRSSVFELEKIGSGVPASRRTIRRQPDRTSPEHKVPIISNPPHEVLENGSGVSEDPIVRVKSARRRDPDVEVQEKLAGQNAQFTFIPVDGSRRAPVPIQKSSIPPPKSPSPPTTQDSALPHAETTSCQAEHYSRSHKSKPNRHTKRLTKWLTGGLKRKYRDLRGGRLEREGLMYEAHEHNDAESYGPIQQGSFDCRVDSGIAILSPSTAQHQVTSKSNQRFKAWMHSQSRNFKSSRNGGSQMTAESMRSGISSLTSKAKRFFSKSRSQKSSRLGNDCNEPPLENPLGSLAFHSENPEQGSSTELGMKNAPFRSHDLGTSAETLAIANSTHDGSPSQQRHSSYAVYEENGLLELDIRIITGGAPHPFQCTFCLAPCGEESKWIQHELSHFPQHGWTCMINGQTHVHNGWVCCSFCGNVDQNHDFSPHSINHCTDKRILDRTFTTESEMKRHLHRVHGGDRVMTDVMQSWNWPQCMNEWYWYCGFCDTVLPSWDKRKDHLNEHFQNGETMSSWNPLTSPYPWSKQLSTLIPGFPHWEPSKLLAIQQHTILDLINKVVEPRQLNQCDLCNITPFANFGEFTRHMSLWHHPKKSWSCPSLTQGWTLMNFFGSYLERREESTQETYFCLCCGKEFFKDSANSDMLKKHLQDEHQFTECYHDKNFTPELFSLHLANVHHVDFDYVGKFAELCRKGERPPALMMQPKAR